MSALQPSVRADLSSLITLLTGYEEEVDENFQLCYDYAASNLLYRASMDPDAADVDKKMLGLAEKLRVHACSDKANDLEFLLDKYKEADVFKSVRHEQADISTRLLSLLVNLAENTLQAEWDGPTPDDEESIYEEDLPEYWLDILAEGEPPAERFSSNSELSDWSDEDDEDKNKREDQKGPGEVLEDFVPIVTESEKVLANVRNLVQREYWRPEVGSEEVANPDDVDAGFSARVDAMLLQAGVPVKMPKVTLSEYQLLREVVWSLRSPRESVLFHQETLADGNVLFHARDNACLGSLTSSALASALTPVRRLMGDLRSLRDFRDGVFGEGLTTISEASSPWTNAGDWQREEAPFTYEAYAGALGELLQVFSVELLKVEDNVAAQQETYTLTDLWRSLGPWPALLARVSRAHRAAIGRSRRRGRRNWHRASHLLAVLHSQLAGCTTGLEFDTFISLYLKSCRPYLRIVSEWVSEGRLEDFKDEFVITRKREEEGEESGVSAGGDIGQQPFEPLSSHAEENAPLDESFWNAGFEERWHHSCLQPVLTFYLISGLAVNF